MDDYDLLEKEATSAGMQMLAWVIILVAVIGILASLYAAWVMLK